MIRIQQTKGLVNFWYLKNKIFKSAVKYFFYFNKLSGINLIFFKFPQSTIIYRNRKSLRGSCKLWLDNHNIIERLTPYGLLK